MFAEKREINSSHNRVRIGATIALSRATQRGSYVCNKTGHLLRISGKTEPADRCDEMSLHPGSATATKISDDPRVTRSAAQRLASRLDLKTQF